MFVAHFPYPHPSAFPTQVLALGGCVTPANTSFIPAELSQQMRASKSKLLFCSSNLLSTATSAFEECSADGVANHLVVIGETDESSTSGAGAIPLSTLMSDDGDAFLAPPAIDAADEVAFLPYSSGTTGLPKGVMLTHRNMVANQLQCLNPIFDTTEVGESLGSQKLIDSQRCISSFFELN